MRKDCPKNKCACVPFSRGVRQTHWKLLILQKKNWCIYKKYHLPLLVIFYTPTKKNTTIQLSNFRFGDVPIAQPWPPWIGFTNSQPWNDIKVSKNILQPSRQLSLFLLSLGDSISLLGNLSQQPSLHQRPSVQRVWGTAKTLHLAQSFKIALWWINWCGES